MKRGILQRRDGWKAVTGEMATMKLTWALRLLVPSLLVTARPKNAIGFSFEGGKAGAVLGASLLAGAVTVAALLYPVAGIAASALPLWLIGSSALVMLASSRKPLAFVKPLCSGCRLLPVIQEHEAIHLSGVESDDDVWRLMRSRHSVASLSLEGDPAICSFCPIPKRLQEH